MLVILGNWMHNMLYNELLSNLNQTLVKERIMTLANGKNIKPDFSQLCFSHLWPSVTSMEVQCI